MLTEDERYNQVDLPFYRDEIAPILPERVLDFHTHTWIPEQWKEVPWKSDARGGKYMVTIEDYGIEALMADGRRMFPGREYQAVCFGNPTPAVVFDKTNDYVSSEGLRAGFYPLIVAGRGTHSAQRLENEIVSGGFFGIKVYLNWYGDDYGSLRVEDLIGKEEMELADRLRLVVLLHVPRTSRLADPEIQEGVRYLSREYPGSSIVLAHCGRAYLPDEMKRSIKSICDLQNVYMDTSMVMDATVIQMVFDNIGPKRVLFATDFPVASMRGRRVYLMDHWVDVVLEGYPPSAFRVSSNDIKATFMAWEIVLAIKRAAYMSGVSDAEVRGVFYDNGKGLLERVLNEKQSKREDTGQKQ